MTKAPVPCILTPESLPLALDPQLLTLLPDQALGFDQALFGGSEAVVGDEGFWIGEIGRDAGRGAVVEM